MKSLNTWWHHTLVKRIVLDIRHSNDYLDYMFMTACFTDKRVVPMIDAAPEVIARLNEPETQVILCLGHPSEHEASLSEESEAFVIEPSDYLDNSGEINTAKMEQTRNTIKSHVERILYHNDNTREAFIHYFPLLWENRKTIYDNPQFFFTLSGRFCYFSNPNYSSIAPVGAVLKAMKNNQLFRVRYHAGGCGHKYPILVDGYMDDCYDKMAWLYCPVCHKLWETIVPELPKTLDCDKAIEKAVCKYDKGQGLSSLSLFDIVDELKKTAER